MADKEQTAIMRLQTASAMSLSKPPHLSTLWKWCGVRIANTVKEEPTISFGVITPWEKES